MRNTRRILWKFGDVKLIDGIFVKTSSHFPIFNPQPRNTAELATVVCDEDGIVGADGLSLG